jgi:opacity protein-like surface antigen
MRGFKRLFTASACVIATTTTVQAADPAETWLPEVKKQFFTDLVSGWYVRGDLGYSMPTIGSVEVPLTQPPVTQWDLQNTWTLGFGGGYKHHWFRSDVTVDYSNRARFQGDTAAVSGYYTAKIDSFTILGNVYLDLGTWGGFTPYIGAGAGTTNLRTHEFSDPTIPDSGRDTSRWNFAWAAMGGIAFRVAPNIVLDVGYRYLKLGDAVGGALPPFTTSETFFRDITAHEARVGLRLMLD